MDRVVILRRPKSAPPSLDNIKREGQKNEGLRSEITNVKKASQEQIEWIRKAANNKSYPFSPKNGTEFLSGLQASIELPVPEENKALARHLNTVRGINSQLKMRVKEVTDLIAKRLSGMLRELKQTARTNFSAFKGVVDDNSKNFIQTIEGFEVKVPKMSKEELLEAFNTIRELKLKIDENMQKEKLRNINQQIEWVGNATGTNPDAFTSDRWNKAGFLKCVEAAAKATEDFSESTTDGGRLSQLGEIDSQLKEHTDTVAHLVKEEINKICTNLISTAQDN